MQSANLQCFVCNVAVTVFNSLVGVCEIFMSPCKNTQLTGDSVKTQSFSMFVALSLLVKALEGSIKPPLRICQIFCYISPHFGVNDLQMLTSYADLVVQMHLSFLTWSFIMYSGRIRIVKASVSVFTASFCRCLVLYSFIPCFLISSLWLLFLLLVLCF